MNLPDMGLRECDIDLILCGHEHNYERSLPIRGRDENTTLTPIPLATATDVIDTTKETVHVVIGGRTSVPANTLFFGRLTTGGICGKFEGAHRALK
jgi:hypothetical protein